MTLPKMSSLRNRYTTIPPTNDQEAVIPNAYSQRYYQQSFPPKRDSTAQADSFADEPRSFASPHSKPLW